MTKAAGGGEAWATLLHHTSSSEEARTGAQLGQEQEGATDTEAMFAPHDFLSPRMSPPSIDWTVPN